MTRSGGASRPRFPPPPPLDGTPDFPGGELSKASGDPSVVERSPSHRFLLVHFSIRPSTLDILSCYFLVVLNFLCSYIPVWAYP